MIVYKRRIFHVILLTMMLAACQQQAVKKEGEVINSQPGLSLDSLVKSDMDMVYEHHLRSLDQLLRQLMVKLYLRNPLYFRNYGFDSAEERTKALYDQPVNEQVKALGGKKSVSAIRLAFDPLYQGDRVAAFVLGLRTMLDDAHGNQRKFYLFDQLDPQKLYNAARNIEVAVWMLSNNRQDNGELFLISNEMSGDIRNLSFERLFGKLIAIQDDSAQLNANATNRTIKNVLQGVAKYVFLPI